MTYDMLASIRHRTTDGAFRPETMVDTLFDYPSYYGDQFQIGLNATAFKGRKFAIVGAGASGLMAAYLLAKSGGEVDIFEASDRIGGRMCSVQFNQGTNKHGVFELGCMRFPPSSTTLWSLFKQFDIETRPNFPDPGVTGVFAQLYYQNKLINWPPQGEAGQHSLPESPLFQRLGFSFGNMLTYLVGNPDHPDADDTKLYCHWNAFQNKQGPKQAVIDAWQKLVNKYKDVTFEQAIYTLGQNEKAVGCGPDGKQYPLWDLDDMNAFGALGVGSGGFGPLYNIGFLEILRVLVNGFEDGQQLVPAGISTLADKMVAELRKMGVKIYTGCPVEFIQRSYISPVPPIDSNKFGTGPVKFYVPENPDAHHTDISALQRKGAVSHGKDYDGLIIATTNRAMQMMGITTNWAMGHDTLELDSNTKTAVRTLHMTSSSKFFIRVKKKFWLEREPNDSGQMALIYPSNIQSDEIFRGLYCLDYDPDEKNPVNSDGGIVLISYTWEDDSTKLQGLTKTERYDLFLSALSVANPKFSQALRENTISFSNGDSHEDYNLSKTNMVDWQAQPYYYGAFKLDQAGQDQFCHDVVYQFQSGNPVVICGDSVSWVGGWMEGALTSAVNAACAVAKMRGCDIKPNGPLEHVKADMYDYSAKSSTLVY